MEIYKYYYKSNNEYKNIIDGGDYVYIIINRELILNDILLEALNKYRLQCKKLFNILQTFQHSKGDHFDYDFVDHIRYDGVPISKFELYKESTKIIDSHEEQYKEIWDIPRVLGHTVAREVYRNDMRIYSNDPLIWHSSTNNKYPFLDDNSNIPVKFKNSIRFLDNRNIKFGIGKVNGTNEYLDIELVKPVDLSQLPGWNTFVLSFIKINDNRWSVDITFRKEKIKLLNTESTTMDNKPKPIALVLSDDLLYLTDQTGKTYTPYTFDMKRMVKDFDKLLYEDRIFRDNPKYQDKIDKFIEKFDIRSINSSKRFANNIFTEYDIVYLERLVVYTRDSNALYVSWILNHYWYIFYQQMNEVSKELNKPLFAVAIDNAYTKCNKCYRYDDRNISFGNDEFNCHSGECKHTANKYQNAALNLFDYFQQYTK